MPALYAHSLFLDQCVRVLPNDSHYPVPRACYLSSLGARSIPFSFRRSEAAHRSTGDVRLHTLRPSHGPIAASSLIAYRKELHVFVHALLHYDRSCFFNGGFRSRQGIACSGADQEYRHRCRRFFSGPPPRVPCAYSQKRDTKAENAC